MKVGIKNGWDAEDFVTSFILFFFLQLQELQDKNVRLASTVLVTGQIFLKMMKLTFIIYTGTH